MTVSLPDVLPPLAWFGLAMVAGFGALVWGAERFVVGAANSALNLGVSPLVIGLTVVGIGTSAPELLVGAVASLDGAAALAVGNAIGSNIANIALILGATALVAPVHVKPGIVNRELPMLLIVTGATLILFWDGTLARLDGLLLAAGLALVLGWIGRSAAGKGPDSVKDELDVEIEKRLGTAAALFWLFVGIALLVVGSRLLVWGAVGTARLYGVSELVIGLTLVAVGTSLPELAASLAAALARHHELALGNIIGSNVFNLLAVLAVPALLAPGPVEAEVLTRDLPVMVLLTLALFAGAYALDGRAGRIGRLQGALYLAAYAGYNAALYLDARPA
ncbi:MAG: sodium:calcium antiporter [Gammaproteobacteria bacterium]|nr:MAG: sodium:calcium antiporter [Gammaproteobacteria bacterium]